MSILSRLGLGRNKDASGAGSASAFVPDKRVTLERLPITEYEPLGKKIFDDALRFWFENREGEAVPDWSVFKAEQHPKLLANIILYERIDGRYFTLIAGNTLTVRLPIAPMGKFLDETAPPDRIADVVMRLDRTLSDGLPNYVEKSRLWEQRHQSYGYNALSMPFVSKSDQRERVLCILDVNEDAEVGQTSRSG